MTEQEAIDKLNELAGGDPECDHVAADAILLDFLKASGHDGVVDAWKKASNRVPFWYA